MLQITEINTDSTKTDEVERLKSEFKDYIGKTANEASVVILCNVPGVGNLAGPLDYIFLVTIKKRGGNYLRIYKDNKPHYIDSFVLLVKKIKDDKITRVDEQCVYSETGAFEYSDSVRINCRDFQEYCKPFEEIRCFTLYQFQTPNPVQYQNDKILVNHELTATDIVWSAACQWLERSPDFRVNSFRRESFDKYCGDGLVDFVRQLVAGINQRTKYGILTKKKLNRISTSVKMVEEIYDNVGSSLSIISGKAGTGKTLALTRIIHKHASNHHNIRFLTFNNLLVFDLKQTLRNFGYFGDSRIAIQTVHQFFYRLAEKLGIPLLLNEVRVKELMEVCGKRVESLRRPYQEYLNNFSGFFDKQEFLCVVSRYENNQADFDEFREFAKFLASTKGLSDFDNLKHTYIESKRQILLPNIGSKHFLEDYYKAIELVYLAVSDTRRFYEDMNIKDRYSLLSVLYKADKYPESDKEEISYENMESQIKLIRRTSNWSKLLIVDECQDFHVLEKETLFTLRGAENLVVASGGKEQLIRHPKLLDWSVSLSKKIPYKNFPLSGGSYRQKSNIIDFVNSFGDAFGFKLNLKSVSESKGLGKVIIDTRPKTGLIDGDMAVQMRNNGEINECSPYESTLLLIPSRNYTNKKVSTSFQVNEKDYLERVDISSERQVSNISQMNEYGYFCWDGVSESKSTLQMPFQDETRVIHYESCRGLEAWSCACMSLDEYFNFKRETKDAERHMADDMFMAEDDRRDRYAALWCLMAFTRPIDTLYIHIEDTSKAISQRIINLARTGKGITVY